VEWEDILEVLLKYPMAELIIHPRLQKDFYKGDIHREAFSFAYRKIKESGSDRSLRLCYNGDIQTPEDYRALIRDYPEIDSVMLGRGLLWNPELAEQITGSREETSSSPDIPRLRRFLDLLYENYKAEMSREGPALMKLKELWSYLALYIKKTPQEMRPLWKTKTLAEYRDVVNMLLHS
jgi:tRNA-dihydrouridine synthase